VTGDSGAERQRRSRGSLGGRLTIAFVGVAVLTIALVTTAALIGTGRGLSSLTDQDREGTTAEVAASLTSAYRDAGGWETADVTDAVALATAAGATLFVFDADGELVANTGGMGPAEGNGAGHGPGHGSEADQGVTTPLVVDGDVIGSYRMVFRTSAYSAARGIAWWWIAGAAAVALVIALGAAYLVTERVARPLTAVAATARRFAGGDRNARTGVEAVGELGDVAHAFDEMADEVAAAERARRRAASDVAHELRTPLTSLQAGLEEIRDGLVDPDPEVVSRLHDQTLRLGRIVEDLSALSAAEGGTLRLERRPVDLAQVARDQAAAEEPRLRASDVDLRIEAADRSVTVAGDPDRLGQVVGNLLSNAARYCRPGDAVTVAVTALGADAVLTVSDTGPGIDPQDLPHVFDRLWRGRGADRVGGSGIGLAVVRELVAAHGGTVEAASDGRTGTQITVTLPLAAVAT
jgi:two-component system sensor histidine kinase BaeS